MSPDPSTGGQRTMEGDDAGLVERLRRNDGEALAMLYDKYRRLAYGLACRIVGDGPEAEDVVQEGFLSFWRQADRFDPSRGTARSYLMTIVHRRAIDALRRRSGRVEQNVDAIELPALNTPDPADFASASEERDRLRSALRALPGDQQRAIELAYFGGLTIAEMAEREGIPLGTAKSRLRLGLERMRKALSP